MNGSVGLIVIPLLILIGQPYEVLDANIVIYVMGGDCEVNIIFDVRILQPNVKSVEFQVMIDKEGLRDLRISVNEKEAEYNLYSLNGTTRITIYLPSGLETGDIARIDVSFMTTYITAKAFEKWMLFFQAYLPIEAGKINYDVNLPLGAMVDTSINNITGLKVISDGEYLEMLWSEEKTREVNVKVTFVSGGFIVKSETLPYLIAIPVSMLIGYLLSRLPRKRMVAEDVLSVLPQREAAVIKLVLKEENVTQQMIADYLKMPKSSLSRLLDDMERRGLIRRVNIGNSNIIKLDSKVKKLLK